MPVGRERLKRSLAQRCKKWFNSMAAVLQDILAGIGPSIGPDHYEVGMDVITQVENAFGNQADELLDRRTDHHSHLNLWVANQRVLEGAGVQQIELAQICTVCSNADWFFPIAPKKEKLGVLELLFT